MYLCKYIYMHMYMYIYICICICMCMCMCMCIYIYVHQHVNVRPRPRKQKYWSFLRCNKWTIPQLSALNLIIRWPSKMWSSPSWLATAPHETSRARRGRIVEIIDLAALAWGMELGTPKADLGRNSRAKTLHCVCHRKPIENVLEESYESLRAWLDLLEQKRIVLSQSWNMVLSSWKHQIHRPCLSSWYSGVQRVLNARPGAAWTTFAWNFVRPGLGSWPAKISQVEQHACNHAIRSIRTISTLD